MKIRRIVSVFLLAVLMRHPVSAAAGLRGRAAGYSGQGRPARRRVERARALCQERARGALSASITKVTTALLVFEAIERGDLRLDQTVTVSASALAGQDPDGSTAGIKGGRATYGGGASLLHARRLRERGLQHPRRGRVRLCGRLRRADEPARAGARLRQHALCQ